MLTLESIIRTTKHMSAFNELEEVPVPRDKRRKKMREGIGG